MRFLIKIVKEWTLPVAMFIGFLGYRRLGALSEVIPVLIFCMLLLTFCNMDFRRIRLTKLQLWLLFIQVFASVAVYYLIAPFSKIVAQAVMICIIAPTATAAAVITYKLRGNTGEVALYTLFSNLMAAVVAPIFFPIISPIHTELSFGQTFFQIFKKIVPLLISPFLLAFVLRRWFPYANRKLMSISYMAFYLWAIALTIAIAQTVKTTIENPPDLRLGLWIAFGSLTACVAAFIIGKLVGQRYGERIAGGQALGQKNTIIAIWLAHSYLLPLAALGAGFYILWQNCINSWQLYRERKRALD
ncbi:MAG: hypothetical protein LBT29_05790 [Flavobacteriaceae bacterium]|jgi:BASS family bile acid:Na+ symporter|nr:hypothetical protein [Flavobacteriaceae bacterium]